MTRSRAFPGIVLDGRPIPSRPPRIPLSPAGTALHYLSLYARSRRDRFKYPPGTEGVRLRQFAQALRAVPGRQLDYGPDSCLYGCAAWLDEYGEAVVKIPPQRLSTLAERVME